MRKLALLLLLAGFILPAFAAKPITVAQVEQLLTTAHGKPDGEVAEKLSVVELSERVSSARLARWEADFPGVKARQALVALADASAFLDLPAAEIPATAAPDHAAMYRILFQAYEYVNREIPQLPNFIATRETTRYDNTLPDSGSQLIVDAYGVHAQVSMDTLIEPDLPLRMVGTSSVKVFFRDHHEVLDTGAPENKTQSKANSMERKSEELVTPGLFGPILGVVLGDAKRGKVSWSHWEQGAGGPLVVYHYLVPLEASHYSVAFPSREDVQTVAAYHGEIAVDPTSGAILRLTEVAELKPNFPVSKANIVVEYGPVAIGGRTYTCPVKSVALFNWRVPRTPGSLRNETQETMLNDARFTQYHIFRAETRILTGDDEEPSAKPPAP